MNNRERVNNLLHYKPVDRMPAVHFGYWPELLLEWAQQGKIPMELARAWEDGNEADRELNRRIGWDLNWQQVFGARMGLSPAFEVQTLQTFPDGSRRVRNAEGLIERIHPGIASIPAEEDYLLKDREAFEELFRAKMQFSKERVDIEALRRAREEDYPDLPLGLRLGSVLGDIRNMVSVVGMSYLLYDEDEDLFADIVDTYAEMQYQCVEEVLKSGIQFDFGHYWEDICFNSGPLLSPETFRELCFKHYKRRNDLCHQYGIDLISLDCDGITEKLLPIWFESGVNILFPIEIGTWGDQFESARKKFGGGMLGVGALDKTALRKDRAAVDAELKRVRRLAELGGYIPCPDHRLMPGTKYELVEYYVESVKSWKI